VINQLSLFNQAMSLILEQEAIREIPERIAGWLESELGEVLTHQNVYGIEFDVLQRTAGYTFLVDWKANGSVLQINSAIEHLRRGLQHLAHDTIAVVAVPYMGAAGSTLCAREHISWLDLSGNAHIVAPGLRIHIEGKPNKFKKPGRPKDIFAPKSSRISRLLLIKPNHRFTQRELATNTGVDEALVSRVVRELEREGLVDRDENGAVKASNPNLLLDGWAEAYSFTKHRIIPGFIAERTSDAVLKTLAESFKGDRVTYAATGLAGAWLLTHFANFRITTFYLRETPSRTLLEKIKFTEQKRGGNVWLVVPNDEGVFEGATEQEGVQCVHPVQVYLDLKGHPERAKEAGEALRKEYLNWGPHAR
jgi:hypothetical protein